MCQIIFCFVTMATQPFLPEYFFLLSNSFDCTPLDRVTVEAKVCRAKWVSNSF